MLRSENVQKGSGAKRIRGELWGTESPEVAARSWPMLRQVIRAGKRALLPVFYHPQSKARNSVRLSSRKSMQEVKKAGKAGSCARMCAPGRPPAGGLLIRDYTIQTSLKEKKKRKRKIEKKRRKNLFSTFFPSQKVIVSNKWIFFVIFKTMYFYFHFFELWHN